MADRHHRPIPREERQEIWRLASEGTPYKTIGERLDRPSGTICKVISDGILNGKVTRRYQRMEERKA